MAEWLPDKRHQRVLSTLALLCAVLCAVCATTGEWTSHVTHHKFWVVPAVCMYANRTVSVVLVYLSYSWETLDGVTVAQQFQCATRIAIGFRCN